MKIHFPHEYLICWRDEAGNKRRTGIESTKILNTSEISSLLGASQIDQVEMFFL
jgi:hypothetical protein